MDFAPFAATGKKLVHVAPSIKRMVWQAELIRNLPAVAPRKHNKKFKRLPGTNALKKGFYILF